MSCIVIVGTQWGDEGKGKIVDVLSASMDHVIRAQGGNNAGHTVVIGEKCFKFHTVPSGILYPHTQCYIGGGTVIDPEGLIAEIKTLQEHPINVQRRLWISPFAHVILPLHQQQDHQMEQDRKAGYLGTTGKGIGPCYSDKINRIGITMGMLTHSDSLPNQLQILCHMKHHGNFDELLTHCTKCGQFLKPYVSNFQQRIDKAIKSGQHVLLEGAQGAGLDITFGTYPYVTSSNTTAAGVCAGAGIGPTKVTHTLGVAKAYATRVGKGPFPTEDPNIPFAEVAHEVGTTTGRARRIGWFDAVMMKHAIQLNGLNALALTKIDVLDEVEIIKVCIGYERDHEASDALPTFPQDFDTLKPIYQTLPGWMCTTRGVTQIEELPQKVRDYIKTIETLCHIPIAMISTGPERKDIIFCNRDLLKKRSKNS